MEGKSAAELKAELNIEVDDEEIISHIEENKKTISSWFSGMFSGGSEEEEVSEGASLAVHGSIDSSSSVSAEAEGVIKKSLLSARKYKFKMQTGGTLSESYEVVVNEDGIPISGSLDGKYEKLIKMEIENTEEDDQDEDGMVLVGVGEDGVTEVVKFEEEVTLSADYESKSLQEIKAGFGIEIESDAIFKNIQTSMKGASGAAAEVTSDLKIKQTLKTSKRFSYKVGGESKSSIVAADGSMIGGDMKYKRIVKVEIEDSDEEDEDEDGKVWMGIGEGNLLLMKVIMVLIYLIFKMVSPKS